MGWRVQGVLVHPVVPVSTFCSIILQREWNKQQLRLNFNATIYFIKR